MGGISAIWIMFYLGERVFLLIGDHNPAIDVPKTLYRRTFNHLSLTRTQDRSGRFRPARILWVRRSRTQASCHGDRPSMGFP